MFLNMWKRIVCIHLNYFKGYYFLTWKNITDVLPSKESNYQNIIAAKSLQSCPTLCDPIDGSPAGSPVPGILQARTLEWAAISFSNAWKWKAKGKSLSRVRLFATPWTAAYQAPPSMGFSRQEYWSGVPSPSLNPSLPPPKSIRTVNNIPLRTNEHFRKWEKILSGCCYQSLRPRFGCCWQWWRRLDLRSGDIQRKTILNFLLKNGKKYVCNSKNPISLQEFSFKWFSHITIAFKRRINWYTNTVSH